MPKLVRCPAAAAAFFWSAAANAAPFCVVKAYETNCWYYSYNACMQAAGRGGCGINPKEFPTPLGGAPFCVVTGYSANCSYYDFIACQTSAEGRGVCAGNPERKGMQ